MLNGNVPVEESKEAQSSCTALDSRSCNFDETHNRMRGKLYVWVADIQKKVASGKILKGCAMVGIVDVLCDDAEHSKLQSIVYDKVENYSDYYLFYTWQFSQRIKELITSIFLIFFLMKVIMMIYNQ
eukprot:14913455-Ditylum_brightwellii.AAC.1